MRGNPSSERSKNDGIAILVRSKPVVNGLITSVELLKQSELFKHFEPLKR